MIIAKVQRHQWRGNEAVLGPEGANFGAGDAKDGDFRAASGALERRDGPWTWSLAVEGVWDRKNDYQGTNAKIGGRWSNGQWDIGLVYLHPDANARPDALALDASFAVSSSLSLLAFGEVTENTSEDAYGLAAKHEFDQRSDLLLSTTRDVGTTEIHVTYNRRY